MPVESAALLAPSPDELPLLFEVSRLLGRHDDLASALAALLSLLEARLGLERGLAVQAEDEGQENRVLAATDSRDAPLVGSPLPPDSPFLPALSGLRLRPELRLVAQPVHVRGNPVGLLCFGASATGEALERRAVLLEAVAILVAESLVLRRRLGGGGSGGEDLGEGRPVEASARGKEEVGRSPEAEGRALPRGGRLPSLVGRSQAMGELAELIGKVAPTDSTVLVTGESGTGKELAARAIHALSPRAGEPFIAVNCAALPAALIESELFGHEKGAFTGASGRRLGRFELADGGSIFLDEVAELRPDLQAKLLRVLQERSFERVGGSRPVRVDVRVIAATNRDLEREVFESRFRADLYWRLAVFPVHMPPLRDRGGDIVLLADYFTEKYASRAGRKVLRISTPALDLLTSYHWPGNVRELENAIERAAILSTDGVIHAYHLPPSLQSADSTGTGPSSTLDASLARLERELIVEALKIEAGNAAAAARRLGITERRMGLALRRFGIDWRRYRNGSHRG